MYNGQNENIQKMLDSLAESIRETRASGSEDNNPLEKLVLIHRDNDEHTWCGNFYKGDYVRLVWKDYPDRNDGYYDIWVEGESGISIIYSVVGYLKKNIW